MKRPEHQLLHGLNRERVDEFLAELAALIEPVEVHFRWSPQSLDPNDEMVLEAATNGAADALVTYNRADFATAAERLSRLRKNSDSHRFGEGHEFHSCRKCRPFNGGFPPLGEFCPARKTFSAAC